MKLFIIILFISIQASAVSISIDEQEVINNVKKITETNVVGLAAPGVMVAIFKDGKIIYSLGHGYSDIENKIKPNNNTLFRIGSLSKTFTGLSLAQLAQGNQIKYETNIEDIIPEIGGLVYPKNSFYKINLKHMLTHRSGIRRMAALPQTATITELINSMRSSKLLFSPGEKSLYSNLAFGLLSEIIPRLTNLPFEEYVQINIFDSLGMEYSSYHEEFTDKSKLSVGYRKSKNNWVHVKKSRPERLCQCWWNIFKYK